MEGFIVMATFLGVYMFYKMYKNDQEASVKMNTSVDVPVDAARDQRSCIGNIEGNGV